MSKRAKSATHQKTHAVGDPVMAQKATRFSQVNCCGEGPLSATRIEFVNRRDTPQQLDAGGPVVLNEGETIWTTYPRRVNEGNTIRMDGQ